MKKMFVRLQKKKKKVFTLLRKLYKIKKYSKILMGWNTLHEKNKKTMQTTSEIQIPSSSR